MNTYYKIIDACTNKNYNVCNSVNDLEEWLNNNCTTWLTSKHGEIYGIYERQTDNITVITVKTMFWRPNNEKNF